MSPSVLSVVLEVPSCSAKSLYGPQKSHQGYHSHMIPTALVIVLTMFMNLSILSMVLRISLMVLKSLPGCSKSPMALNQFSRSGKVTVEVSTSSRTTLAA